MTIEINIHYNDGAYYGTMTCSNMSQTEIEQAIQDEISANNSHMDKYADHKMYHIGRENFTVKKEVAANV